MQSWHSSVLSKGCYKSGCNIYEGYVNEHDLTILKITYYKLTFLYIFKIYIGITRQNGRYGLCVPLFFVMKT